MTLFSADLLLVDDNLDDAELAIRALKRHRIVNNLVHLKDGQQAIDYLFSTGPFAAAQRYLALPKLVLLDIQMPKVNGIQVLQKIKADERTRSTPVVMLTSSKEDPDIRRCYALGANSYIVKPVNFERFSEAIQQLGLYWLLLNQAPV